MPSCFYGIVSHVSLACSLQLQLQLCNLSLVYIFFLMEYLFHHIADLLIGILVLGLLIVSVRKTMKVCLSSL